MYVFAKCNGNLARLGTGGNVVDCEAEFVGRKDRDFGVKFGGCNVSYFTWAAVAEALAIGVPDIVYFYGNKPRLRLIGGNSILIVPPF